MNHYIKFIISFAVIFMYSFFGFLWWSSTPYNNDLRAWHFFEDSKYNMVIGFVQELEKQSSAAKYPLYLAYAFREKGDLNESTAYLKKALKPNKTECNPRLTLEIYLNLSLNGYLKKDLILFKESLIFAKEIKSRHPNLQKKENYTHLFEGIDTLLEKNYAESLILFQKEPQATALSPWMKSSFEKVFSKIWIKNHLIYCLIQDSKLGFANEQLNEMTGLIKKDEMDSVHFLKGLMLFKEAFYIEANLELQKIKNQKMIVKEFEMIFEELESDLLSFSINGPSDHFLNDLSFLQNSLPKEAFEVFLLKFFDQIETSLMSKNRAKAAILVSNLPKEIHAKFFLKISKQIEALLKEKKFKLLENYLTHFVDVIPYLQSLTDKIETLAFTHLSQKHGIESITDCINLWCSLETSSYARLIFAKRVVNLATSLWLNEKNYQQALELFKKALTIPSIDDQLIVTDMLEKTFFKIQKKALNEDRIEEHFHILNAVKALKLNYVTLYTDQEKMKLIDDAEYFFTRNFYEKAYEMASFLLMLEPQNFHANRILGLISFEKGDFIEAYKTLKKIQNPDKTVLKALKDLEGI